MRTILFVLLLASGVADAATLYVCPINGPGRTYNPQHCRAVATGIDLADCMRAAREVNRRGGKAVCQ